MRRNLILFLCSLITLFACACSYAAYQDINGNKIDLTQTNKWLIINYWASWCGACAEELPELDNFYKNNVNKNILLYGVNYDHLPMPDLAKSANDFKITFPVITDDPQVELGLDDVDALPTTFIINPKGKVVKKIVGATTEESLNQILQELQHQPG